MIFVAQIGQVRFSVDSSSSETLTHCTSQTNERTSERGQRSAPPSSRPQATGSQALTAEQNEWLHGVMTGWV